MRLAKQKSILVIEDEEDILFTLKDLLEAENYEVLTAENGLVALEILKHTVMPDLILLDMRMPVMNGWEFAAEFLAIHNHSCPIIVLTAAADARQRARDIQAADWLEKPFDLEVLLEKVNDQFNKIEGNSHGHSKDMRS